MKISLNSLNNERTHVSPMSTSQLFMILVDMGRSSGMLIILHPQPPSRLLPSGALLPTSDRAIWLHTCSSPLLAKFSSSSPPPPICSDHFNAINMLNDALLSSPHGLPFPLAPYIVGFSPSFTLSLSALLYITFALTPRRLIRPPSLTPSSHTLPIPPPPVSLPTSPPIASLPINLLSNT
jgi:hypothetical protein